ncbi:MAG: hypothetical protein IJY92_01710 [Alphaproteobacteria bacterium]|nr:hypothetical protein [Alphaproteobacteria bacterium]
MGYLVDLAKKKGIKPNPHMTLKEARALVEELKHFLKQGQSEYTQKKMDEENQLSAILYARQKCVERPLNEALYEKHISLFTQEREGIITATQFSENKEKGFDRSGSFVHQIAENAPPSCERFVCDIDITSQEFPNVFEKLRSFILKHQGSFKVPYLRSAQRSDALNCYLSKPITNEIAAEFYQIVKPCLKETFDEKLDGVPIYFKGEKIKGIRIGPEYHVQDKTKKAQIEKALFEKLNHARFNLPKTFSGAPVFLMGAGANASTTSSLGEKCSQIEVYDFVYYMAGMEGKSPIQLSDSHFVTPYQKQIDISDCLEKDKKMQSSLPMEKENLPSQKISKNALARRAAAYFVVKNGVLQFKDDLSPIELANRPRMNIYETLGIKARPLKNSSGQTYAYAPTGQQDRKVWNDFLNLVRTENHNNAEPVQLSRVEVNKVLPSAAADFKAEGSKLYFRNKDKKQHNAGKDAYLIDGQRYSSLPDVLRSRYHIFTIPLIEKGEVVGFNVVGGKAQNALQGLLEKLKTPEKYDLKRLRDTSSNEV